VHWISWRRLPA